MSKQQKLVGKMQKLLRKVKDRTRGALDKMDLREEVMAASDGVVALIRGQQRRIDESFGQDVVAQEAFIAIDFVAADFDRFDFDAPNLDFGVRMVLASGLVEALGLQAGDKVSVREGEYKGQVLTIEVADAVNDELRFADDAGKSVEVDIAASARVSSLS